MYLIIIFLPLIGAFITGFFGRLLGYYGASIISTFCVFFAMILSYFAFYEIGLLNTKVFISLNTWFESGILLVNWNFIFDSITVTMLIVITTISTLVHLYSINYMEEDPHFPRFMAYLEIFTFFMLILVTASNIVQMFVGWEGVGLASYLLINFWNSRLLANKAAIKALIVNRIGDFGLTFAIIIIFYLFRSVNYFTIFSLVPFFTNFYFSVLNFKIHSITLIGCFLLLGAIGKSAQLGLHTWLPDAMEGPTPVSALIHAATMVTAGVFLIIRFSPLIEFSGFTLILLTFFGSFTAFFAAISGVFQHDLKKVIAYSTCSQLGYMMFCCGLSCYNVSLFHLTNHAFFKALLFLSAGSVIHAISDEQDMRRMGSLQKLLPVTYSLMLIGSMALIGFPFMTGFYSKDIILEISNVFRNSNLTLSINSVACWFGNLSVFFTSYYSFRLIYLTFLNSSNLNRTTTLNIHESSNFILIPLIILGLFSIFFGYTFKDFFIGLGCNSWDSSIFIFPKNFNFVESEFIPSILKWVPFFLSLLGAIISTGINLKVVSSTLNLKFIYLCNNFIFTINKKWYFDTLYNKLIVFPLLNFGYFVTYKSLDRGFIELMGPYGFSIVVKKVSILISKLQTGQITHYLFIILFSFILIVNFILFDISIYYLIFYFVLLFFI